jgi:hypothetical protein
MTARELHLSEANQAALNERVIAAACRKSARRRLKHAQKNFGASQGRGGPIRALASRELECALAEAQEWGVA